MSDPTTVSPVQLEELGASAEAGRPLAENLELVHDVKVRLVVSVGGAQLPIRDLYALRDGSVLPLDKATGEPVELLLDGKAVARGELMVSGDQFAIRITEVGRP